MNRLRQLRVRNDTCDVDEMMQRAALSTSCYGAYSPDNEDTGSFGLADLLWDENNNFVSSINALVQTKIKVSS